MLIHGLSVLSLRPLSLWSQRLLLGKSASQDAEHSLVGKLRAQCGAAFTKKLEGMFRDVDLSVDLMKQYREHAGTTQTADADESGASATPAPAPAGASASEVGADKVDRSPAVSECLSSRSVW